jgi:competence protein ComFC
MTKVYNKFMFNILDLIFPRRCVGCGNLGSYICQKCQKTIKFREQKCPECDRLAVDGRTHVKCLKKQGLDGLYTVFENRGVMRQAIKTLKYRFVYDLVFHLIELIPQNKLDILKLNNQNCCIYPIPLHKDRLKWRGFNQSQKLAQILDKKLNLPLVNDLLIRQVKRIPQADILHKQQRIENAKGLFVPNLPVLQSYRHKLLPSSSLTVLPPAYAGKSYRLNVLLVDDIWTTGATIKEATKILKRGGVDKVWAVTLAR